MRRFLFAVVAFVMGATMAQAQINPQQPIPTDKAALSIFNTSIICSFSSWRTRIFVFMYMSRPTRIILATEAAMIAVFLFMSCIS